MDANSMGTGEGPAVVLADMPRDELLRYGTALGLELQETADTEDLVREIRQRQELLIELDRDALLDIIIWSRRPVRQSASKEELAREIARLQNTNYDSLSRRGLVALSRLRNMPASEEENAHEIIDRLKKAEGFWKRLHLRRRSWVGSMMSKLMNEQQDAQAAEYQFLPEDPLARRELPRGSIKEQIQEKGIVGGIASRLRGAADDYIKQKLDEIERRIDDKMNEIDRRLAEWRDREVANRLRILRITLIFSVLVAVLSLGYKLVSERLAENKVPQATFSETRPAR